MRKIIFIILCGVFCLTMGCEKMTPNPYALTKEARKLMKPDEQEAYVNMIKSLEQLMAILGDENLSNEEIWAYLNTFSKDCPETWDSRVNPTPLDQAWQFFMEMMEGFSGTDGYGSYADCKDAVDALGKEITDYFEQRNDRRKALLLSEQRFDDLYGIGKQLEMQ